MLLFPIETSNRELIPKLYLAFKFAEKGYSSYVGQKGQIHSAIKHLKSPVYFDKGYHKGHSEKVFERVKKNKGFIISLDEENGIDYEAHDGKTASSGESCTFPTLDYRFTETALSYFDLIFLWGRPQYKYLENLRNNFNTEKAFYTCHPRFDLLKRKFQKLYDPAVDSLKSKYGNFILFNMAFGFGNNVLGEDFVVKNYGNRVNNIRELVEYQKEQIKYYFKLIKLLSEKSSLNIIVRPHPEEDIDFYKKHLGKMENVKVIHEGPVIPWIIASRFMIHPSCTTAVEASMLGKTSIFFGKNFNRGLIPWIPVEVSKVFSDYETLIEYINGNDKISNNNKNTKILEEYFSFGTNSVENIIKEVHTIVSNSETSIFGFRKFHFWVKSNIKLLTKSFLTKIRIYKTRPLFENKFGSFDKKYIQNLVDKMIEEGMINKNIKVSFFNREMLKIYSK